MRAALIPQDDGGDPVIINLPPAGPEQLAELQRRVGGDIELIRLPIGDLWINEDPRGAFGRNTVATQFVAGMSPGTNMGGGAIFGPAVLTGVGDKNGDITDLKGFTHTERESSEH